MPARIVQILLVLLIFAGLSVSFSDDAHARRGVEAEATADLKLREGPGLRHRAVLTIRAARVLRHCGARAATPGARLAMQGAAAGFPRSICVTLVRIMGNDRFRMSVP